MMLVPLHGERANGRSAMIDDSDYALVIEHRWYVWEAKRPGRNNGPYAIATIKREAKKTSLLSGVPVYTSLQALQAAPRFALISMFDCPGGSSSPGLRTKAQCRVCLTGLREK